MSKWLVLVHFDGTPIDPLVVQHLADRLKYRGPDGLTTRIDENIAFIQTAAHVTRRMAREQLPLTIGALTVTGSIRLDERERLLDELEREGCQGLTLDSPDSVLFLHAFRVWGDRLYDHLQGQFSAAVWDSEQQCLHIYRDHMGQMPVYYAHVENLVVVSDELGAIRRHPAVPQTLNDDAVADFLLFGSVTGNNNRFTVFRAIHRLESGSCLEARRNRVESRRCWTLPIDQVMLRYKSEGDYIDHYLQVLSAAIKDRLDAENIVVLMSGGLDSTSIAAVSQDLIRSGQVTASLTAYTSIYESLHEDTEQPFAQAAADYIGIPIHFHALDNARLIQPMPVLVEPSEEYTDGNFLDISREILRFGRLMLYGEGADSLMRYEPLFDVLRRFPPLQALDLYLWLWRFMKRRPPLVGLLPALDPRHWGKPRIPRSYEYPAWINPDFERAHHLRERWETSWEPRLTSAHRARSLAYATFTAVDWASDTEYHQSLPLNPPYATQPFLDLRVVNFLLALPPIPWFRNKYLFRQAMQGKLPPAVLERPKTPLGAVLSSLLAQPESSWVDDWQPSPLLSPYVIHDRIPKIHGANIKARDSYVNIRPLLLNHWLVHAQKAG